MDKATRNLISNATQAARRLLEEELAQQLEGVYDILPDGTVAEGGGSHLGPAERLVRDKIGAVLAHKRAGGKSPTEAVDDYLREAAFTCLNRFVALKMLEARELVRECVSRGDASSGFREFCGLASGLASLPDKGYRLYVESLFDELSTEIKVLFDRHDPASLLWPRRQALSDLLVILNSPGLAAVWGEDETIGWVYQYFNSGDERRKMREESQAPRNSRELAVRNQFFTPRYVVQFLTDNTLGRIWYEMRRGDTALVDQCAYMVRDQEIVAERPRKDPRDIRLLDPAGGSGHFLLYAFDLFLVIYEEAWNDQGSPKSKATGRTLREDYPDLGALRRVLPALILNHNLHAVDIDPRCVQIAALALWMRAQRAYRDLGLPASERAPITRIHVVVAEPMPGDRELLREFVATLGPELGQLVRRIFERLELAGEAGSLLQVEDDIRAAIRETYGEHGELFRETDEERWLKAEEEVREALREYAERAADVRGFRRRLFAGDASQGLGLIDLCSQRYEVTLMNPPFGGGSARLESFLRVGYPDSWTEIYAAFFESAWRRCSSCGLVGSITSSVFMHTKRLQEVRRGFLSDGMLTLVADLGSGVLDGATVDTCLTVRSREATAPWVDYIDLSSVELAKRSMALIPQTGRADSRWRRFHTKALRAIPGSPFCFHADPALLACWARTSATLDPAVATVATGNHTFDDERFLRLWWEVPAADIGPVWRTYDKGGDFQPFLHTAPLVVNWRNDGAECRAENAARSGSDAQAMQSSKFWGMPALNYMHVSSIGFSPRIMPSGTIFSSESISVIANSALVDACGNPITPHLALLALLCSTQVQELVWVFGRYRKIENRAVSGLPIDLATVLDHLDDLARLGHRGAVAALHVDSLDSTTRRFILPELLAPEPDIREELCRVLSTVLDEIDNLAGLALGIPSDTPLEAERRSALVHQVVHREIREATDRQAELLSWALGVTFGIFDIRVALADHRIHREQPDLFDALPSCCPGMLTGRDGLPLGAPSSDYPVSFPLDGILVDDTGHGRDLVVGVQEVFMAAFGGAAHAAWGEVSRVLGLRRGDLREWFACSFFERHIKRYSKCHRKAPIYWQLATASAGYSVWLCYPRLSRDTFFKVLNDYAEPKLRHEEQKLRSLRQDDKSDTSIAGRTETAAQESSVDELRAFRDEVARVAPLWKPNLDDGVIINFAPLWRLVPQHKAWQRECKACWDKLVAGEYDWAHLAMHLWPERVVPKCASDRSLAIAHGLGEAFWEEDESGKWLTRRVSQARVEELVQDRTSPAVKAALQSLLDAPSIASGRGPRAPRRQAVARPTARSARAAPEPTEGVRVARGPAASDENLRAVCDAIAASPGGASRAEVMTSTGVSATEWNAAISALLERGDVVRTGEKRGARYFLKGGLSA